MDLDLDSREGDIRRFRQHLNQFHSTGSDRGQEQFSRSDLFAGTSVLLGTIDDEVVITRAAQDAAESIGCSCPCLVLPDIRLRHEFLNSFARSLALLWFNVTLRTIRHHKTCIPRTTMPRKKTSFMERHGLSIVAGAILGYG